MARDASGHGHEAPTRRDYVKYGGAVIAGGLLAGCVGGGGGSGGEANESTSSEGETTTAGTEAGATTGSETADKNSSAEGDGSGSYSVTMSPVGEVAFDAVPETVVSYDDQWADHLVALGQGDRLVALGNPENFVTAFYGQLPGVEFDPGGLTALLQGDSLDKEMLYELDADVHHLDPYRVLDTWGDGWERTDVEEIGTNVGPWFANRYSAYRDYGGDRPYQYYSVWELARKFAAVYQVPARPAQLKRVYDEMVASIRRELPPMAERPRVALSVYADGTFYGQPSPSAPGFGRAHVRPLEPRNAFAEYPEYEGFDAQYDMEAMAEVNPDVFIQALGLQFPVRIDALADPEDGTVASTITAFETGRVYNGATDFQGPIYTLFQTEMTAKQIYPELFGEWRGLGNTPEDERLFDRKRVADIINGGS